VLIRLTRLSYRDCAAEGETNGLGHAELVSITDPQ
jgi:hypothetical protein